MLNDENSPSDLLVGHTKAYTAVLVPADVNKPCATVALPARTVDRAGHWRMLHELVGQNLRTIWYDRDVAIWLDETALGSGKKPNLRANRYVSGHSEFAAHINVNPDSPMVHLFGDLVFAGAHWPRCRDNASFNISPRIALYFRARN